MARGKVAILGAGLMGAGIAADCLAAGYDVAVTVSHASSTDVARARVEAVLGTPTRRLTVAGGTSTAASGAELVLESLPEDVELKVRELRAAERAAPDALLATNTSSLSVTRIAEGMLEPERLIGLHFLNPPSRFRVVEVVPGIGQDPALLERARSFLRSLGKHPIELTRDIPGFLINRLQMALLRECVHLVDERVASPEDIDLLVEEGLGRRWAALGPFATASLGGAALFERIAIEVYPSLAADPVPTGGVARRALSDEQHAHLRTRRARSLGRILAALDSPDASSLSDDGI
jgi:3-hydroxybutyryl-CoA dehydrogenase